MRHLQMLPLRHDGVRVPEIASTSALGTQGTILGQSWLGAGGRHRLALTGRAERRDSRAAARLADCQFQADMV